MPAAHKPTDESKAVVSALVSYGVPVKQVAQYLGIDDKTLSKHYRAIMDEAMAKAHAKVGKFLYQAASGDALQEGASFSDCLRAAMFYAKTQMQWRETNTLEHTGPGGGPVQMQVARIERVIVDPQKA